MAERNKSKPSGKKNPSQEEKQAPETGTGIRKGDRFPIVCVGASAADHDLSGLEGHRLRTHGGVSEAKVPFILSAPLNDAYKLKAGAATLKSYQIFDYAINGVVA